MQQRIINRTLRVSPSYIATQAAWRYSPRSALAPIRLRPLIFRKQLRRRSPPRLILEIDIRERLSVVVVDGETRGLFLDGPRSRKTTWRHLCRDQNAELKRSLGRSPPRGFRLRPAPLARSSAAQRRAAAQILAYSGRNRSQAFCNGPRRREAAIVHCA
jgi:hypothetical protein